MDDYAVDRDRRNDRNFLFECRADADGTLRELQLRPVEICDYSVHRADWRIAEWCRNRIRELCEPYGTGFERGDEALVLSL